MTTSETETPDYASFVDTRVRLVYIPEPTDSTPQGRDPDAEEIIAFVAAYNAEMGVMMVRPRRKTMGFLVETFKIIEIEADNEPPKPIKQKVLKETSTETVRQHLADRHGYSLSHVNSFTDEQAETEHNLIDHTDLGHAHEESDPEDSDDDETDAAGGVAD